MTKISVALGFLALLSAFLCNQNSAFPTSDSRDGGINAFLLIVEKDSDDRGLFSKTAENYPVRGLLHSCLKGSEGCACEGQLKSSVADLLTWARSTKEMSIGSIYQAAMKQTLESTTVEKLIAQKSSVFGNSGSSSISELGPEFNPMELFEAIANRAKTSKDAWLDSFETMLQNVSGIREKKILLAASTSESQYPRALQIFQRYFSIDDTLLVVLSGCSQTSELMPFFAAGPGSEYLKGIKGYVDVAPAIRQAIEFYQSRGLPPVQKMVESNMPKSRYPRQGETSDTTPQPEIETTKSAASEEVPVPKTTEADKSEVTTEKADKSEVATEKAEKSEATTEKIKTTPKTSPETKETSPVRHEETSPKLETTSSKPKEVATEPATISTKFALPTKFEVKFKARSDEEATESNTSLGESNYPSFFLGAAVTFVTLCMSY